MKSQKVVRIGARVVAGIVMLLGATGCNEWPFAPPPTATPRPTMTREPSRTPRPTLTPMPTRTPRPTGTPTPTPAPRVTPAPKVGTVVVVVTGTPAPAPKRRVARSTARPNQGAWFFTPHPNLKLRNPYRYSVEFQTFERGSALYIREKGQTWIFGAPGQGDAAGRVWSNESGDLVTVAQAFQLGSAQSEKRAWTACAGDTEHAGAVTAYMLMPDKRVLAWTIRVKDYEPLGWSYLAPDALIDCADYAVAPEASNDTN